MQFLKGSKIPVETTVFYPSNSVISDLEGYVGKKLPEMKKSKAFPKLVEYGLTESKAVYAERSELFRTVGGGEFVIDFEKMIVKDLSNGVEISIFKINRLNGILFIGIEGVLASQTIIQALKR